MKSLESLWVERECVRIQGTIERERERERERQERAFENVSCGEEG